MTTFPALVPSSRTFTPGEYPATAFNGFSGAQNRVRHSNVFLAAQLRLTFLGLDEAEMLDIWDHYSNRQGEFRSFDLPTEVVSYGSITDYVPGNYLWRYAGPGSVEDLPCGGHNVSLTLETVPPIAASVVGADLFLRLRLRAGAANGGEYAPGINETITLSVTGGAAFVALNGISEIIDLSISAGIASGDVEVEGISEIIYLGLAVGAASNSGVLGIDETIGLSLVAGAASDGTGSTDPDFASVSLLLHMDGSNGSTTFTDSSSNALTITANGDAQISTAQSKFGGASGLFDGNADYITLAPAANLQFDADFTIEVWIYPLSSADMLIGSSSGDTNTQVFRINQVNVGTLSMFLNGLSVFGQVSAGITANQWQHLAIARNGSDTRIFVDGEQKGSTHTTWAGTFRMDKIGAFFFAGSLWSTPLFLNGYIDDLRITKGVARYTANFTPPTAAFPDS
jgi:hypothetical protein